MIAAWRNTCGRAGRPRLTARVASACLGAAFGLGEAPGSGIVHAAPAARFAVFSVEDGLSQNTVQTILQDHAGFLWFGTEEGLNRFDGYDFVVFKHDAQDPKSLPDDVVSALHEDRHRRLWVGTASGLSLFDRQTGTFAPVPSVSRRVTSIIEDPDGTLWIATWGEGLFERDPGTGAFVRHGHDRRDPSSLGSDDLSALLRDEGGRLWIGTRGAGVDRLQGGTGADRRRFVHYRHDPRDVRSLSHDEVWDLAEDPAGNLWVATYGGGLSVLDGARGTFHHYRHRPGDPVSLRTDLTTCLFFDRSGALWAGTDGGGLHRYDPRRDGFAAYVHDAADPGSLSQDVVRTIYEDVQGQLWVGTFMGGANLLKTPRRGFSHFVHQPWDPSSLSHPSVASFLEDRAGRIWVGTEGGGLDRFDRSTGTFVRYTLSIPGHPPVLSLHEDRRGRIWVGTYRGGLARFDPVRGTVARYRHEPGTPQSLSNDEVWAITEEDDGTLWLGTNGELDRFDPARGVVVAHHNAADPEGRVQVGVRALHRNRAGDLWIGTMHGLHVLRRGSGEFVHYHHSRPDARSLSHDMVVALHEDRRGRLWAGTYGGGLNRFDAATGAFTSYKGPQGLPSNVVHGILEDSSGHLWLSTNRGLSRFDPATERFENFDRSNGLESLQFHLGARLKTRSGRLLFGSASGFYDLDPAAVKADTHVPPVALTSFRIFNEPAELPGAIDTMDEITLTHRDKVFSFDFAAIDFTFPRRNRYRYLMEGFSDRWIELGEKREVTFTNLDPGAYVFRVRSSNSDGIWNERGTSLRVVIRPPFWRTVWFRALGLAAAALALFTVHRVRVHHLHERGRELALRVEEAVARVRLLKGLLPICSWCKRIRDDTGYWNQVEAYIRERSEADFTHGICPECAEKYRGGRSGPPGPPRRAGA